jgi:hypothetical protein
MRVVCVSVVSCVAVLAGGLLAGAPAALADGPLFDGLSSPLIDEVRLGLLAHSIEGSNDEGGADINAEVLFRKPTASYGNPVLDVALRPRIHLGVSLNTSGETNQLYAGLTWDVKLAPRWSVELSAGGSLHDGPTESGLPDSYGCPVNFRESASLGYAIDDRWTIYGTLAHMSNANACDQNTGITSVGVRLGYKLK